MSGGSYDYLCFKIDEAANRLTSYSDHSDTYHRQKFAELLKLVGKAMHDIEWVDSCDCGPGDEVEAIEACFKFICGPENFELFLKKSDVYKQIQALTQEFLKDE